MKRKLYKFGRVIGKFPSLGNPHARGEIASSKKPHDTVWGALRLVGVSKGSQRVVARFLSRPVSLSVDLSQANDRGAGVLSIFEKGFYSLSYFIEKASASAVEKTQVVDEDHRDVRVRSKKREDLRNPVASNPTDFDGGDVREKGFQMGCLVWREPSSEEALIGESGRLFSGEHAG